MSETYTISFDQLTDIVLWKYPADAFAATSSILIKDNQKAVIVHNGKVCDMLDMGVYLPGPDATPRLYEKLNLAEGYTGMIKADLWFVNIKHSADLHWQTDAHQTKVATEAHYSGARLKAEGTLQYCIANPAALFSTIQPNKNSYTATQLFDLLADDFASTMLLIIKEKLQQDKQDVSEIRSPFDSLAGFCRHYFNETKASVKGYELISFDIQSLDISTPSPRPTVPSIAIVRPPVVSAPTGSRWYLKPAMILAVVLLLVLLYNYNTKAAIACKARYSSWRHNTSYYVDQAGDSSIISQYAFLSSDADIADINNSFFPYLHTSVELNVDNHSTDHFALFFPKGGLAPIKEGSYRYVYVRFDEAPEIQVMIDTYKKGEDIIYMYHAGLSTDAVENCKKLRITVANTTQNNKKVQYTFSTSGLKW